MITLHDLDTANETTAQNTEFLEGHLVFNISNTTCHGNLKSIQQL